MCPMPELSDRLREIVDALPLRAGSRVLEIGCGPGAMAREMAARIAVIKDERVRPSGGESVSA